MKAVSLFLALMVGEPATLHCHPTDMALDIDRMQKIARKLRIIVRRSPKRPSPDEIHDLRTHTRRLESTLAALGLSGKGNERRLLQRLRRIRKRAGKIRDMDVLVGHASQVHVADEGDCLVQVLEHLGAQRYRHAERLHGLMRRSRSELLPRLKRTTKRFQQLADRHRESTAQSAAAADATASVLQLSADLRNPRTLNRSNLHSYRLKVKELRYVLQLAEEPGNQNFLNILGEIKNTIGEWHDWEQLIAIAKQVLDRRSSCKLLSECKAISQHKYEQGLALTEELRANYLRPLARKKTRLHARAGRTDQPILEAASAIAA